MILILSDSETPEEDNIFGTFRAVELIKIHGSSAVLFFIQDWRDNKRSEEFSGGAADLNP